MAYLKLVVDKEHYQNGNTTYYCCIVCGPSLPHVAVHADDCAWRRCAWCDGYIHFTDGCNDAAGATFKDAREGRVICRDCLEGEL